MADEFASTGGFQFDGESTTEDSRGWTDISAYTPDTARSGIYLGGIGAFDFPPAGGLAADGGISFGGYSVLRTILNNNLSASGVLAFGGPYSAWQLKDPYASASFSGVAAGGLSLSGRSRLSDAEALDISEFAAAGDLKFGGVCKVGTPQIVQAAFVSMGGFSFGGYSPAVFSVTPPAITFAAAGGLSISGRPSATFFVPLISALIAGGGLVFGSPGQSDVFEAWALSGQAFEPSIFSGFNFDSLVHHQGRTFAAGDAGIYLLGGDSDAGVAIHPGARIGPANFGTDDEKRIRGIQFGNAGRSTRVRVRAVTSEDDPVLEEVIVPGRDENRVVASRDIRGREFIIDIVDFTELGHLQITPLKLSRR